MIPRPSAIFLDWDGTLVDSYRLLESAHSHARKKLGFPALREGEFRKYFGKPREILYRDLYGGQGAEAKVAFEDYYMGHHLNDIEILPGAQALLETICNLGIPMGVVTNKRAAFIQEEIPHLGWERFFAVVVGSGDAAADKPDGAPLKLAIQKAGLKDPGRDIWLAGDTENDMLCAQNAGCSAVLIAPEDTHPGILSLCKPLLCYKNCQGFREFLLQNQEK